MPLGITYANRHRPVYSAADIIQSGTTNIRRGYELLQFNQEYPTWRHWHHHVHSAFGIPCDDMCKPKHTYTGSSLIQRIKAAYVLEDVAGRLTYLHGNGKLLKGKCPLHNEQRGESFTVWPEDQRWKCWGACGIGGDVVDLARACNERGITWQ